MYKNLISSVATYMFKDTTNPGRTNCATLQFVDYESSVGIHCALILYHQVKGDSLITVLLMAAYAYNWVELYLTIIRLRAQDFYRVIADEDAAQISYHA